VEIDVRLVMSIGALFASIIGAAAIARYQIASLLEQINELKKTMAAFDGRLDRNDQDTATLEQRTTILAGMMSPDTLEKRFRELTSMSKDIEHIKERLVMLSARIQ
jgi:chromosome segregation ATPase